ncbi:MAG: NUDIX hydrolase [Clostridia bacterium]|nr:NUDIX hydrolase [Clostridia bacterium]
MTKLLSLTKQTNNKYVNIYLAQYKKNGKLLNYEFASRRAKDDLALYGKYDTADAVRIVPYFEKENEKYIVLIKEFRQAINTYVYGVPAGLVEKGEQEMESAKRELVEEIGAEILQIKKTDNSSYSSAGMTDESISCFEAEVKLSGKQTLEFNEDITIKILKLKNL